MRSAKLIQHQVVEALFVQIQGDRVEVRGVLGRDNRVEPVSAKSAIFFLMSSLWACPRGR